MNKSLRKKVGILLIIGLLVFLFCGKVVFADQSPINIETYETIGTTLDPTPTPTPTPTPSSTPTSASVVNKEEIAKAGSNVEIVYVCGLLLIGVTSIVLFKKMNNTKIK